MTVDTAKWSGEGAFTQRLVDRPARARRPLRSLRVEDAPASRSEADYNFISNEIFVRFATGGPARAGPPLRRAARASRAVVGRAMTCAGLEAALDGAAPDVGAPDYSDDGMLQYLRTERIVPPYQTRGYKLVELVRIYEAGAEPARRNGHARLAPISCSLSDESRPLAASGRSSARR